SRVITKATRARGPLAADLAEAMAAYERALALRGFIDFDDLIGRPVRMLTDNGTLAALYQNRFRWISVDEFQDVDEQQYRLLTLLAPPTASLCMIGDPNQAIYGFRGADAGCCAPFKRSFPTAAISALKRNYRSPGTIVAASAQVIAAHDRAIGEIVRDMHERITIETPPTQAAEAETVVKAIERMIGGHSFFSIDSGRANGSGERNVSFGDFAVLYRTDVQSAALCEAFDRSGIPYKRSSHAALTDDPAVRALLHELREAPSGAWPDALRSAAERLAQRGASMIGAPALQRLVALVDSCGKDRARFLDAAALASEAEFWDARADRVPLMTLHVAKGLEFRVVFIVGLEDGLLPLRWNEADDAVIAEERRLFYVGMTRAKDRLILSRARQRHWRGRLRTLPPSPFLHDIETQLLKQQNSQLPRAKPQDRQLRLF